MLHHVMRDIDGSLCARPLRTSRALGTKANLPVATVLWGIPRHVEAIAASLRTSAFVIDQVTDIVDRLLRGVGFRTM
jgi:hypothetical protein